ncbi:MAG: helix-turn-helix transcriptional regulator [Cyclobacteriaceae bacterium]
MKSLNLHIKDMVCPRCILVVEKELSLLGAKVLNIELGHVAIAFSNDLTFEKIDLKLREFGFELIENREEALVEKIKAGIISFIKKLEQSHEPLTLSDYLAKEIGRNYNYLSKLFSNQQSQTIESFYINKRIERVKSLLKYDQLSLSEIAIKLGYSSVYYLSGQFKKFTGISVSEFKKQISLENYKYNSISEALQDLKQQGFIYDFSREKDLLVCLELNLPFRPEHINIKEEYRFKESSTKKGRSAIFSIDTGNGVKGLLVESEIK